MLRRPVSLAIITTVFLAACATLAQTGDTGAIVSHNDVIYLSPARQGWEGLPLGNGTLGAQVWQPDGLMFQLNTPLSGVYGGALCRVRVRTTPSMLTGMRTYRQRLSLYDATLSTEMNGEDGKTTAVCQVPSCTDALLVEYADTRPAATEHFVEIEAWRDSAQRTAEQGCLLVTDVLKVQREPDYRFAVIAAVEGAEAVAEKADAKTIRLRVASGKFTLILAVVATREPGVDVVSAAKTRLAELRLRGLKDLRRANAEWWFHFWEKSFLQLRSDDGVADYLANLWYMHLYAMAAGSRGEVPPKFNGGLWTDNRDEREWGPAYWHWNTQECYWPIFAANHLELHRPYQEMYWKMLPAVKKWTKETWEADGAQYQETIAFNGAMGVWQKERGLHPRLPVPKHVAHTNLILSSSAEIAMQFWWAYQYTGDLEFLRGRAYPMMKEMAAFYVAYLEKDAQGRYNMFPSNAHETFWKVKNPATDLAALRYFFPMIIEASKRLEVDADLRAVWQDRLEHLAPYAIDPKTGAILPYELLPGEKIQVNNAENPELAGVGVFPSITLGSPDYDLAVKTFRARRNVNGYGWTTDSICAARLGLAEPAAEKAPSQTKGLQQLLPLHAEMYQDHPSGLQDYYGRKPAIHPYLEGSGTMATALGEMLLQSWDGVVRVCPALPKAWSADFKLLAMGGFEVTGHAEKGRVVQIALVSQRGQPVRMANPFGGQAVVACGDKKVLASDAAMLEFPTEIGKTYVVTRAGSSAAMIAVIAQPNEAPKYLGPAKKRCIGKPEMPSLSWRAPAEPDAPRPPALSGPIDRPVRPEVKIARLPSAPKIDGDLGDDAWKSAQRLGPLVRLGKTTPAAEQTEVLVGCDEQSLYFGITCWESRMDGLLAEYEGGAENHDMPVFTDDSVEIFLRPGSGPYWRFVINALGATLDALGSTADVENRAMNPQWKVATARRSNRWIVEAAIPFSSLVAEPPAKGDAWGLNVGRNERPRGETCTWAPLAGESLCVPEEFGRMVFTEGGSQAAEPIAKPNLVGHWTFEEIKGIWTRDVSGHRHHAMLTGPMKLVEGKRGKALELTGAGYVEVPDAPALNLSDAMTLALWVYPKRVGSMRLIDKGPVGGSEAYLLDTHPENNIRVIMRPAGTTVNETLPMGQWSHVAVTLGGGKMRVYLNGRVVAESNSARGTIAPSRLPLRLGADSQGGSRFVGLMDDVRIYCRALGAEEVKGVMGQ